MLQETSTVSQVTGFVYSFVWYTITHKQLQQNHAYMVLILKNYIAV